MYGPIRVLAVMAMGVMAVVSAAAPCKADEPLPRSVLILEQSNPNLPSYVDFSSAFSAALNISSRSGVDVYTESLDIDRFGSAEYEQVLLTYFRDKYRSKPIGVIVPVGTLALEFVMRLRKELWRAVPIAFAAVDAQTLAGLNLPPDITGNIVDLTLHDAVNAAKVMVPGLRRIAIVGDPLERQTLRRHFARELPQVAASQEIIDLTGLPMTEITQRVALLPPDSAILYLGIDVDGAGKSYTPRDALVPIAQVANRPIVVTTESQFGYGATGGVITSFSLVGKASGQLVSRILDGESAAGIPIARDGSTRPIFDSRQLQRFGISEAALPVASEVRFRELTAFVRYRWQILSVAAVLGIQTGLIIGLFYERRRRRTAEAVSRDAIGKLAHMNRVATAGELSASLANEINQPLAAMVANANAGLRFLARATPELDEAKDTLKRIVRDGHRAGKVVGSVRDMFKKDGGETLPVDLNDVIQDVIRPVRGDLQAQGIVVQTGLTKPLPMVLGHNGQLQQVILNLVRNAAEAMDGVCGRPRVLRVESAIYDSDNVLVAVEDTGTGIDQNDISRIFDLFYTTKLQGMGMGLSICRSIVESHGGRIWASSDGNCGAVFSLKLPAHKAQVELKPS
jgi:signal transduction histidine kinase